jgi:carnitine O-acetyltransferase
MGLKTQLREGETHALFEDEFYAKSQEWKLSTSAFSAGQNFLGVGFGAAWPDGYGINCMSTLRYLHSFPVWLLRRFGRVLVTDHIDQPGKHLLKFGIESKVSCEATSTSRFKHHLVQSLRDMRRVCEAGRKD